MNLKKAINVTGNVLGDGASSSAVVDLLKDPYDLSPLQAQNWFSDNRHATEPTSIFNADVNSYSLFGTTVTITFASVPPNNTIIQYSFWLLF